MAATDNAHPLLVRPFSCDLAVALATPIPDAEIEFEEWLPALERIDNDVLADASSVLLGPALQYAVALRCSAWPPSANARRGHTHARRFSSGILQSTMKWRQAYPSLASLVALSQHPAVPVARCEEVCRLIANIAYCERSRLLFRPHSGLPAEVKSALTESMRAKLGPDRFSVMALVARRALVYFGIELPDVFDSMYILEVLRMGLGPRRDAAATEAVKLSEALLLVPAQAASVDLIHGYVPMRRALVVAACKQALAELEPEPKDAGLAFARAATDLEKHALAVLDMGCQFTVSEDAARAMADGGVLKAAVDLLARRALLSARQLRPVCGLVEVIASRTLAARAAARLTRDGHALVDLVTHVLADVPAGRALTRDERELLNAALSALRELVHHCPATARRDALLAGAVLRPPSPLNAALTLCVDHARLVGASNFAEACGLTADIVQTDPSGLEAVALSELGRAFLLRLLSDPADVLPRSAQALLALPELYGVLAQCAAGKSTLLKSRFVHRLLSVMEALGPARLPAGDVEQLGGSVEDFVRNTPWVKKQCTQDLADFFAEEAHSVFAHAMALEFSLHVLVARDVAQHFCEVGGLNGLMRFMLAPATPVLAQAAQKVIGVLHSHACKTVWQWLLTTAAGAASGNNNNNNAPALQVAMSLIATLLPDSYAGGMSPAARWEQAVSLDALVNLLRAHVSLYKSGGAFAAPYAVAVKSMATWLQDRQAAATAGEAMSSRLVAARELLVGLALALLDVGDVALPVAMASANAQILTALAEQGRLVPLLQLARDEAKDALITAVARVDIAPAVTIKALDEVTALAEQRSASALHRGNLYSAVAHVEAASRLVQFKAASAQRPQQTRFAPDVGVASALAAMGYVPFHVKMAQLATRSNNMLVLSNWLMENHALLTDEDEEVQAALWMSLEPAPASEDEANEAAKLAKETEAFNAAAKRTLAACEVLALALLDAVDAAVDESGTRDLVRVCVGFLVDRAGRSPAWVVDRLCTLCPALRHALDTLPAEAWAVTPGMCAAVGAQLESPALVAHAAECLRAMAARGLPLEGDCRAILSEQVWAQLSSSVATSSPALFATLCGVYGQASGGRTAPGALERARTMLREPWWRAASFICHAWASAVDDELLVRHAAHVEYLKLAAREERVYARALARAMAARPRPEGAAVDKAARERALRAIKLDAEQGSAKVVDAPDAVLASEPMLASLLAAVVEACGEDAEALGTVLAPALERIPALAVDAVALLPRLLAAAQAPLEGVVRALAWADAAATARALVDRLRAADGSGAEAACELVLKVSDGALLGALHAAGVEGAVLDALHAGSAADPALRLLLRFMQPGARTAIATGQPEAPDEPGDEAAAAAAAVAAAERETPLVRMFFRHQSGARPPRQPMDEATLTATLEVFDSMAAERPPTAAAPASASAAAPDSVMADAPAALAAASTEATEVPASTAEATGASHPVP